MSFLENLAAQLPFGKKSEDIEYFFALNIGLSEISCAVWAIYGRDLDILGKASLPYNGNEDLVEKVPKVLDKALGVLEIEPQKVLFGVPDTWSVEDNLKEPYLKLLQSILKEYDLAPLAYVSTTNAIAFTMQKQEGIPPTAILLGIGEGVEVTLVRGGKVVEGRSAKRGDHLFEDVERLLQQFTEVEVLPSKIILYGTRTGEDITKIKDELMSYPWMSKLSFLHFPKIDILDEDVMVQSIIIAGAFELNPDINLKKSFAKNVSAVANKGPLSRLSQEETPLPKNIPTKDVLEDEDLGFVKGDIKEQESRVESQESSELDDETEDLEDDNLVSPDVSERSFTRAQFPDQSVATTATTHRGTPLDKIKLLFMSLLLMKNKIKLNKFAGNKLIFAPIIIVALLAAYLLFARATVTIFVEPKILERDSEVIADPKATVVDEARKIIPASTIETTVSGSGKGAATGSKQIGDPAKGKVVVYNLTSAKVSFSQGTILTSGSLKFTLDQSVQIASQSSSVGADFTTVITPGKTDPVGITAALIGPDGNLPGATELSAGGYTKSQVVARVTDALSGGTSKEVKVVTSDDQKKLQAQVTDELRQKAQVELSGKLTGDKKIIPEAMSVVDGKYTFNKQVNDQASEFNLSASVHFKGSAYNDSDLRTIVSKLVEVSVPDGFQLNLQESETQADVAKVDKDGKLTFKAKFRAKLLPKLDINKLKSQIKGKSVAEAVDQLKGLESVLGSEINISPSLPGPLSRLPFLTNNITINITPK